MGETKKTFYQAHRLLFQLEATARFLELDRQDGDERNTAETLQAGAMGNPISNMARIQQGLLCELSECLESLECGTRSASQDRGDPSPVQ